MPKTQRERPKYLADKLLAIRTEKLNLSQARMVQKLGIKMSAGRISEYERGIRMPDLIVILAYARAAGLHMEVLADDRLKLPK